MSGSSLLPSVLLSVALTLRKFLLYLDHFCPFGTHRISLFLSPLEVSFRWWPPLWFVKRLFFLFALPLTSQVRHKYGDYTPPPSFKGSHSWLFTVMWHGTETHSVFQPKTEEETGINRPVFLKVYCAATRFPAGTNVAVVKV